MTDSQIPFLDLISLHRDLKDELSGVFVKALETGAFIGGPMVEGFERGFAAFCEAEHCVGVGSGTDALRFALIAAGVAEGHVVVTVPNTFIATVEAISQTGAVPVFVDIDERTYNMDPAMLRTYLEGNCSIDDDTGYLIDKNRGRRVAAVVPVHLYGQMADMDAIRELTERYGLTLIEDACQAHGAEYYSRQEGRWRKAGSIGKAAAFSFYPGKNLGACGEAGAVTTNDAGLARTIRMLRDHGQVEKYYHDLEGYNGRLDAIQAGILHLKLARLAGWNEQRRACARRYNELFAGSAHVGTPHEPAWSKPVYHLYIVRVAERAELQRRLNAERIGTGIHYPVPLHLQKAYKYLAYTTGEFPMAERVSREILSLPMFPGLTSEQQERVAEGVLAKVPQEPAKLLAAEVSSLQC